MPPPSSRVLEEPKIVSAHANIVSVPSDLNVIPFNENSIQKIKFGEGDSTYVLTGNDGDTIVTGQKIRANPDTVKITASPAIIAKPGRMRDAAINNLTFFDVENGLGSSYITSIIQDKRGNIWFGTWAGIVKFDGVSFVHFGAKEGLNGRRVHDLLEDRQGNIWIATSGGVYKYNGDDFLLYNHDNSGLTSSFVFNMEEDEKGAIWCVEEGSGLMKIENDSIINYSKKEGLPSPRCTRILIDTKQRIWIGTIGNGLILIEGDSLSNYTTENGLSSNFIFAISEDTAGDIWISSSGKGIDRFNGESITNYALPNDQMMAGVLSNIFISFADRNGNLWFGANGEGLIKLTLPKKNEKGNGYFTQYQHEGEACDYLQSIWQDKKGNIWYGSNGGGAGRLVQSSNHDNSGEGFTFFSVKNGLSNNYVYKTKEDEHGNIWFVTDGGTISKYDGSNFTNFDFYSIAGQRSIYDILFTEDGSIWVVGNGHGAAKINNKTVTQFTIAQGLNSDFINAIFEDKNHHIWFGTYNGLTKFDGKEFTNYNESVGLPSMSISSIIEAKNGDIWIGTYNDGVTKFDGTHFINYSEREGLCSNKINTIFEDEYGNLWFGTVNAGLIKFDGFHFTNYTEREGLAKNGVTSLISDQKGGLFVGTDAGLSHMTLLPSNASSEKNNLNDSAKSENGDFVSEQKYKIINYTIEDGLKCQDFLINSAFVDSKNRAWWGGGKCLIQLDLNNFNEGNSAPEIGLRSIEINEQFVDFRNCDSTLAEKISYSKIQEFENYPLDLSLPYSHNHLTFHYSAIDWNAPHKVKYQFILKGFDKNWSAVTSKTEADYRNIPYGDYTFVVRAIGQSQVWSENFEFKFVIQAPWWHTWWFRILMVLVFIFTLYLLYRSRTASLRLRQKKLEKTVEERTEDLIKEKELVETKHKEISDSINYAERIQRSFLATKELLDENLKDYFVFFQPKDIVSGDFYWASKLSNGNFALVTADSTGHGVPGAIMSIANIACLKESVTKGLIEPAQILNETRKLVIEYLKNDGSKEGGKDGMDASLVCFDLATKKLNYAAANNPVWIVRQNEILEFAPDKMPVGKHDKQNIPFTSNQVELKAGDVVYTLTDGMPDQFGGEKGKKFMYKKLKELLISIAKDSMEMQKEKLNKAFFDWKGDLEQVDDVCVIGVRV